MASLPVGTIQKVEPWDGAKPYYLLHYYAQADAQLQAIQHDNALANQQLANVSNMIDMLTGGGYKQSSVLAQPVPALPMTAKRFRDQNAKSERN